MDNQLKRDYEREVLFYQDELSRAIREKIIIQSMLDEALSELDRLNKEEKEEK